MDFIVIKLLASHRWKQCLHWGCWGGLYFPQTAMSGLRTNLGVPSVSWHLPLLPATSFSAAFPEPARLQYRASHTRAAVQTALDPVSRYRVGRGLFPSQALRHEPVSHPRPPVPQQAESPPDSPRRAVRHAIQHAVGRTASPARLWGSVVPKLRHPVGGEHPTATRCHPRGGPSVTVSGQWPESSV